MTESTCHALCEALDDEFKARATYRAVVTAFGPICPFVHSVASEQRHSGALQYLFACKPGMVAEVQRVFRSGYAGRCGHAMIGEVA